LRRRHRSIPLGASNRGRLADTFRAPYPDQPSGSGILPRKEVIAAMLSQLTILVRSLLPSDDDGQGLAEYALILALIAIVSIVALLFLGSQISDKLNVIGNTV
jgi:pilus assembly protein Flp/PilA